MADATDTPDVETPDESGQTPVASDAADQGAEPTTARIARVDLEDLGTATPANSGGPVDNLGRVLDVSVALTARVGVVRKTVSDIIDLSPGSIVDLERGSGEPIDLVIGDKLIARGEIVVVDDHYGVRIVEVLQD